ncbi:pectin esterase [Sphingomonas sp. Leaf339]|nr:pectin esterase [Sphingomonas sp. Leaf339]
MAARSFSFAARWWRLATLALLACTITAPARSDDPATYHVRKICDRPTGCFTTIQAAVDAAKNDQSVGWVLVDVGPGDFNEKVVLNRDKIRLMGAGPTRTRLHFDSVAEYAGHYDRDNWGTPGSATLAIAADDVAIRKLTIENTFDYLANDALPPGDPRKISNSQGLAVLLDTDSDRISFDKVHLIGYQDTLFTHGKRALFRNGVISGNIDFIFGSGMLLIENSTIRSRRRAASIPPGGFASFITAPSTPANQPIGIVIYRSRLTREPGVADGSVALGRPWHPTTTFPDGRYADPQAIGQAIFIDCFMDAHIHPDHWTSMAGTAPDGSKNRLFHAADSRFFEQGSSGPGSRRRPVDIKWTNPPTIAEVRQILFAGWDYPMG